MKNVLYDGDLFIAENSKLTYRESRTNTSDIINYVIPSTAIYNNIQNNDLSSDHSAILFDFSTNINRSILLPIKVKLYHKADWDYIDSFLSKKLAIIQDQVVNLISSDNPINIIDNAALLILSWVFITIFQKKSYQIKHQRTTLCSNSHKTKMKNQKGFY